MQAARLARADLLAGGIRSPVLVERYQAVHVDVHEAKGVVERLLLKGNNIRDAGVGGIRELDGGVVGVDQPEVRQVPGVEQEGLLGERVADLLVGREGGRRAARVLRRARLENSRAREGSEICILAGRYCG